MVAARGWRGASTAAGGFTRARAPLTPTGSGGAQTRARTGAHGAREGGAQTGAQGGGVGDSIGRKNRGRSQNRTFAAAANPDAPRTYDDPPRPPRAGPTISHVPLPYFFPFSKMALQRNVNKRKVVPSPFPAWTYVHCTPSFGPSFSRVRYTKRPNAPLFAPLFPFLSRHRRYFPGFSRIVRLPFVGRTAVLVCSVRPFAVRLPPMIHSGGEIWLIFMCGSIAMLLVLSVFDLVFPP